MIDVIIADHQELFRAGLVEVLSVADNVRIVGQAQSPEQLLDTLKQVNPDVLVLSTNFLPVFPKIQRMLTRRKTALLLLAEENDQVDYMRWLRAQGIVYRSVDVPVLLDTMRRVARGELFVQNSSSDSSSDIRKDKPEVA
jgi:DNA-binding NarL/FixJ family response regulator